MNRVATPFLRATTVPRSRFLSASARSYQKPESDLKHPALLRDPPADSPSTSTDPWSLQPPLLAPAPDLPISMAELLASPHPEGRDHEPVEILRKRLVYESRKRGILEMDLILATFANERLGGLGERELREYDRFLTLPDWSIYYYVTNKAKAPEPWASSWILQELLEHSRNRGRSVRKMPSLESAV